jgi:hypothetical protein
MVTLPLETHKTSEERVDQILFLGASPSDAEALPIDEELELLKARLQQKSGHLAKVSGDSTTRFTATVLTNLLKRSDFDILHLVGHGTKTNFSAIGAQNQTVSISPGEIVSVLKLRGRLKLVVLSSCYGANWTNKFLQVADAVVGMPSETYAVSAREFTLGLYENLYSGMSLADAVKNATLLMRHLGDTTTDPTAMSSPSFGGPEHTYLHRRPELLARFDREPPRASRKDGTSWYSLTGYVRFAPHLTESVRAAKYIESKDKKWSFERVQLDGGDYEFPIECWGNAGVAVLIEDPHTITAIRSNVVQMLSDHYAISDEPPGTGVAGAIEALRRDGKPEKKRAVGRVVGFKRAAKKPAKKAAKR